MNRRWWPWAGAVGLYVIFWLWYMPQGGPLSPAEQERFSAALLTDAGDPGRAAALRHFMAEDSGGPFIMVNLLHMADSVPDLPATGPGATADSLLAHYMQHMYPELARRASHPVFVGTAVSGALDVAGIEGAQTWTRAALVRYRSRRDMLEVAADPAFADRHEYKLAALAKTIAFPVEAQLHPGDPRLLLALALLALAAVIHLVLPGRSSAG
jgi:hypothetical protein